MLAVLIHLLYYGIYLNYLKSLVPIDNGNPEETVRLVRGLNQDNLPLQYRSGVCPTIDLTGVSNNIPTPKPNPDGAVNTRPLSMFIGAFTTLVLLLLFNIV